MVDVAQDERRGFDIVDDFPFMLRHSKHSESFFSSLLAFHLFEAQLYASLTTLKGTTYK
jgi:hypothetical protein